MLSTDNNIHRRKYDGKSGRVRKSHETRALLGARFKVLLSDAGLTHDAAAKLLHVTPRTVKYWVSGRVMVPYSAYKLVRVMRLFELPVQGWEGWHMHSGKLWSPEGFGFTPECQDWWSLLVRQARLFRQMSERERQLDIAIGRMRVGPVQLGGPGRPVGEPAIAPAGRGAPAAPTGGAGRAA